ncbi:outer membrane protein assembly factor BamD [Pararhizobium mangrovi]|uniref:Outer membrane protein assembly factor BamD n=1 Tax=Pararhizobium mangrovi TaxID=2590452 RepID=A0A506U9K6_9HYPH|nr:outer membrane protein assembly factor BamD [Pararhizobium mangrovi]TPW29269.1 outer membrane protein assembly factor BamD [Pararhizobium mangrovi]
MSAERIRGHGRWLRRAAFASIGAGVLLVAGCSNDKDIDITTYATQTDPADVLFNEGLANLKAGNLSEAGRKFEAVDQQHPYSDYAKRAIVLDAWVNYRQGNYTDAVAGGKRYLNLYPTDDDAAYAQYIIGLAYYKQIPDVTRDQTPARQTEQAMQALVDNYPKSEYVADARQKIRFARNQLAGKDMQVGRYYQERNQYLAAINRYKSVVQTYPKTDQIEEALARLVECYYALGLTNEAQEAAAVLGHNYPQSEWYKDSYALLEKNGLKPNDRGQTWLSRAGRMLGAS